MTPPRYLVPFAPKATAHRFTDVLVIGAGIAGLRAALAIPPPLDVLVVTKDRIAEANSAYAQGGIAGVLSPEDRFENHIEDTLAAGAGLCDRAVVELVVREAPKADRRPGALGHAVRPGGRPTRPDPRRRTQPSPHRPRPRRRHRLRGHAGRHRPRPPGRERDDLGRHLHDRPADTRRCCVGAVVDTSRGQRTEDRGQKSGLALSCPLSSDAGLGQARRPRGRRVRAWSIAKRPTRRSPPATAWPPHTAPGPNCATWNSCSSTPPCSTSPGRRGFSSARPCAAKGRTCATRTASASCSTWIRGPSWPPRDVVARAIFATMERTQHPNVYLDLSHLGSGPCPDAVSRHRQGLPRASASTSPSDRIPVRPGAHYMVGGVTVDIHGHTTLPGLWAAGEVTSSGLHGANRLASNQPARGAGLRRRLAAAEPQRRRPRCRTHSPSRRCVPIHGPNRGGPLDVADITNSLRSLMVRKMGIVRDRPATDRKPRKTSTSGAVTYWAASSMTGPAGNCKTC